MMNLSKESTHYLIISNIWLAASLIAPHRHDTFLSALLAIVWFVYGIWVSRTENSDEQPK